MESAEGRQIAWFLHRPLFLDSPDEADTGYWSVKPEPRGASSPFGRGIRLSNSPGGNIRRYAPPSLEAPLMVALVIAAITGATGDEPMLAASE